MTQFRSIPEKSKFKTAPEAPAQYGLYIYEKVDDATGKIVGYADGEPDCPHKGERRRFLPTDPVVEMR